MSKKSRYNRNNILKKADKLTSTDREVEHGDASKNFEMVSDLWSTYLGVDIFPHEVPMMMVYLLTILYSMEQYCHGTMVSILNFGSILYLWQDHITMQLWGVHLRI